MVDPSYLIRIVTEIESQIKRELNDKEEDMVVSYAEQAIKNKTSNISIEKLTNIIVESVIEELHLNHCNHNVVDVHEMLKHNLYDQKIDQDLIDKHKAKVEQNKIVEVNIESVFGLHDISTIVKKVNEPISSVNTAYFILDSRYRILGNDGTSFFKWGHINSLVRSQGTYNSVGNIRDIINVKLLPFRIPSVASAITPYNRISTFIQELCPQSYVAHEDSRFHFLGDVKSIVGKWIEVDPDNFSKGEFKFNKPITHLDSITMSFGSPLEPIIFDKDRLQGTISTYGNPTEIEFPELHNLTTGDIVYITKFNTKNPDGDDLLINQINKSSGNIATVINSTKISIPVNTSSLASTLTGTITAPSSNPAGTITATKLSNIIVGIGTTFLTDFVVGDYIQIQNNNNLVYKIISVLTNTKLTIQIPFADTSGTFTYKKTGISIIGNTTSFSDELNVGDNVIINDGATNPSYTVATIPNVSEFTITQPYIGSNGAGFTVNKDNIIPGNIGVFFGSKRLFIPMEITYLSS
jgi:hypothetical protein